MKNEKALEDLSNTQKLRIIKSNGTADHHETDFKGEIKEKGTEAKKKLEKRKEKHYKFPIDAFPETFSNLLKVFHDSSPFPPEYYYSALLSVTGLCIANKFKAKIKNDFIQPPILYLAIIGKSGIGKSGPIKTIFSPLYEMQKEEIKIYKAAHSAWNQQKKEAEADKNYFDIPEPKLRQLLFEYATLEGIWDLLTVSQDGLSLCDEELSSWVSGMDQYKSGGKGGELGFWLKNYDNSALIPIVRKGQPTKFIYNSSVNIFGGIQPGVIKKLAEGDKTDTGFLARFLMTFTEHQEIPEWKDIQPDITVYQKYKDMIKFMFKIPSHMPDKLPHIGDVKPIHILFTDEAKARYIKFYNELAKRMNGERDDTKFSQLSKFRGVALRLALIMEIMFFTEEFWDDENWRDKIPPAEKLLFMENMKISLRSVESALKLTEYFIQTSMNILARFDNILNTYDAEVQEWYKALPERFKGNYAVELGEEIGVGKKATVYRKLRDTNLFTRNKTEKVFYKNILI